MERLSAADDAAAAVARLVWEEEYACVCVCVCSDFVTLDVQTHLANQYSLIRVRALGKRKRKGFSSHVRIADARACI